MSGESFVIIIILAVGLLLFTLLRRRSSPERNRPETVRSLLSEVRINEALAETFELRPKPQTFETTTWQLNKGKLTFFTKPLQDALSQAFTLAEQFNREIRAAKKDKSYDYKAHIQIDKMREPLAKSKEGLEEWLMVHVGGKEPPTKFPSLTDTLFGGR
jgi:hypothetical protein